MGANTKGEIARSSAQGERQFELGRDLRFLLVSVGGGGIRVGREVARRHIRHLETTAVNCDRRVLEEKLFDKQIFFGNWLGESLSDTGGSPAMGSAMAHASEEEFEEMFHGATCVTVVASLGGGSGTGILPILLEALTGSEDVAHLTLVLIKPFAVEEERRRVAERAMAGLYFVSGLTELIQKKRATVMVLDNENRAGTHGSLPLSRLISDYADQVANHIAKYISVGEAEITAVKVRNNEYIGGSPVIWPGNAEMTPAFSPMGIPQGVTAYLKSRPVTAPARDVPDVELVVEAEASPTSPARPPKDLPMRPE